MFSLTYFIKQPQPNWKRNLFPGHCIALCFLFTTIACNRDPIVPNNPSNQNNARPPIAMISTIGLTITYPTNKTILDGTGSIDDLGIKSYKWILVSGQGNGNPSITHPDSSITTITGLAVGSYKVQLTVINQKNIASSTYQDINVLYNQNPFAFAGEHQVVIPNDPVMLNGRGTRDENMTDLKLSWKQVAGPTAAIIAAPNSITTSVTQLSLGTYSFELSVVDEVNQTSVDTVHIAVRNPGEIEKTQVVIKNIDFLCPFGCSANISNYKAYLPTGKTLLQVFVSSAGGSSWERAPRYSDAYPLWLLYSINEDVISIYSDDETRYSPLVDVKLTYF